MFWLLDMVLAWGSQGTHSEPWLLSAFEHHQTSNDPAATWHVQPPQELGQPRGFPILELQKKGFPSPLARAKKHSHMSQPYQTATNSAAWQAPP